MRPIAIVTFFYREKVILQYISLSFYRPALPTLIVCCEAVETLTLLLDYFPAKETFKTGRFSGKF